MRKVTAELAVHCALAAGLSAFLIWQAGSAEWRTTQNAGKGGDYGHHMSRAACNIAGTAAMPY